MRRIVGAGLISILLGSGAALAGERTVTLNVDGMACVSCSYQVKSALKKVNGVTKIVVALAQMQVVVSYDDAETDVSALRKATKAAGYPSKLKAN